MILLQSCRALAPYAGAERLEGRDILIRGPRIAEVGRDLSPRPEAGEELRVIDCSRLAVVPGFINTHHHFYQTLTRALPAVQNVPLFSWLKALYEIWKRLDEEAVYWSSLLAMGELLKTGCTATTDHHYLYPRGVRADLMGVQFEAASVLGMRFAPCRGSMSLSRKDGGLPPDSVVQSDEEILKDSLRVIETYHDGSELSMRRIALAPCSPFSVTRGLMEETVRLARTYGVRLHTHLAETADEERYCLSSHGRRPLALMMDWGFVGPDVWYAHGVHFNDEELEVLASTGTAVAHCPSSNMRLGSGIARVREMLDRGITVGLGVDGSASNDSSDFLGEMRQALLLQRVRYGASGLRAQEALAMATEHGARILDFPRCGRLEPGWAADLALFDLGRLDYAGAQADPIAALVFAGISHQAEYTIVNGRITVEKGRLTGYDEEAIAEKANLLAARLLQGS